MKSLVGDQAQLDLSVQSHLSFSLKNADFISKHFQPAYIFLAQ